jgi:DNA-directed RNA polymerase II subunit RPB2
MTTKESSTGKRKITKKVAKSEKTFLQVPTDVKDIGEKDIGRMDIGIMDMGGDHIDKMMSKLKGMKLNEFVEKDDTYGKGVLAHIGDYTEEPFSLIESYFEGKHLERLVRHQIESYNHFINLQIQRTIQMFNPVAIHADTDYIVEHDKYMLEVLITFENLKMYPPQIHENNGATKNMLPQEAKLRNFTYAASMAVDLRIKYVIRNTENMDTPRIVESFLPKINIGKMPIMLKSSICMLTQNNHIHNSYTGECSMDSGGYFIIKGSEKTV